MTENKSIREIALEEAVNWLLTLNGQPEGHTHEADFRRWLAARTENPAAWQRACRSWQAMGMLAPARIEDSAALHVAPARTDIMPAHPVIKPRYSRPKMVAATMTALAACLVLALTVPDIMLRLQAEYMTETAQSRRIALEDGSLVELGAHSAITTRITATGRHVKLLAGEAYFDVTHDPGRPFTVEAGGADVTVLGTAFNVALSSASATVELERGAVQFSRHDAPSPDMMALAPGEVATLDRDTGTMTRGTIAVGEIGSWREGMLFVNDATIAAVVEQLQRYHGAWITVPEASLAEKRVTGLYDLRDPDRALHALVEPFGGKVRGISSVTRILTNF